MTISSPRQFLTKLFFAAVAAADPLESLKAHLPARPKERALLVGAGKARRNGARPGDRLGRTARGRRPDPAGLAAAKRLMHSGLRRDRNELAHEDGRAGWLAGRRPARRLDRYGIGRARDD